MKPMSSAEHRGTGPLSGIRVADFTRVLAGPLCTMSLADYGAEVIKIESPAGDETRAWTPPTTSDGLGTYYATVNRNKYSVCCDLKSEEGLAHAREIVEGCDVVVENFRPGVMARHGLDDATLRAQRPGLVYCSISGFGDGAGADLPGYDLLVQALGGLMSITGQPEGEPSKVGVALVDVLTGQNALAGILLALRQRDQTGEGQTVTVSLLSSLLAGLSNQASSTLATGTSPERLGNAHASIAPYDTFSTRNGKLAIGAGNDRQFLALVTELGLPELGNDPRFSTNALRVEHQGELKRELENALDADSAAVWQDRLMRAGVPAGKVNNIAEAIELAQNLGLEPVVSVEDSASGRRYDQLSSPIRLSATPASYRMVPPALGEHQAVTFTDHSAGVT
ncbi:CAIB/BAIF family protein [Arthrobacter rhombi]|uniref:CAIB/BAIF family protein n=2 Tax=Arthrobacter rhombi TaxID=71253 RepID=A0A1R4FLK9_9MICC|nr:CAIB/BAIF family protein [Arthrobacter rhombi]